MQVIPIITDVYMLHTSAHFWIAVKLKRKDGRFLVTEKIMILPSCLYTHTQTRFTAFFPGLPGWAATRKVKPIWILLKHETVSGSGISWAICKSAPRSRQITTPAPHHLVFYMPFLPPTNSIKALKRSVASVHLTLLILPAFNNRAS